MERLGSGRPQESWLLLRILVSWVCPPYRSPFPTRVPMETHAWRDPTPLLQMRSEDPQAECGPQSSVEEPGSRFCPRHPLGYTTGTNMVTHKAMGVSHRWACAGPPSQHLHSLARPDVLSPQCSLSRELRASGPFDISRKSGVKRLGPKSCKVRNGSGVSQS